MGTWPTQGETPWDVELKGYIDDLVVEAVTNAKNIHSTLDDPVNDIIGEWTIADDDSEEATWAERFTVWFHPTLASPRRTFYLNEYGEARGAPGRNTTVPFRVFTKETTEDPDHNAGVPVIEVMDNRDDRNRMFAVHNDGQVETNFLPPAILVLGAADPVPAGTPAGSVILRTA